MAEWLLEHGIGEDRAILVNGGRIVEAVIELPSPIRAGAVVPARVATLLIPGRRAIAELEGGQEALLEPLPPSLAEGGRFRAEVVREGVPEPGRARLPKVRATDAPLRPGAGLADRLGGARVLGAFDPDLFERAGWSETLEEASRGEIAFAGGALRMSLTPAMTLFDVDGNLLPESLAIAGAAAAGQAIRRFGIAGSIGIDLPTLPSREARQRAAAALDAVLPQPFERTSVNGFGFLQVVRRRERPSLPELLQADPVGAAARALLRMGERTPGHGPLELHLAPPVAEHIGLKGWDQALSKRTRAEVRLQPDAQLPISGGHVQRRFT